MPRFNSLVPSIFVACTLLIGTAQAQQNFDKVEIKTEKLSPTTYVLYGAGGNIGVSVGDDALFIIDDQYAPVSPKILAALNKSATSRSSLYLTRTGTAITPVATKIWVTPVR